MNITSYLQLSQLAICAGGPPSDKGPGSGHYDHKKSHVPDDVHKALLDHGWVPASPEAVNAIYDKTIAHTNYNESYRMWITPGGKWQTTTSGGSLDPNDIKSFVETGKVPAGAKTEETPRVKVSGAQRVSSAIEEWTSPDLNAEPLAKIFKDVENGKKTPAATVMAKMVTEAREAVCGDKSSIELWRAEVPRMESDVAGPIDHTRTFRSYTMDRASAKAYAEQWASDYENPPAYELRKETVSKDRIMLYYKQNGNFVDAEKEVIVSDRPFKVGRKG